VNARTRASLLWGAVGGLSFLVLLQGYHLLGGESVSVPVAVGATVVAAVGSVLLTRVAEEWLARRNDP